VQTLDFFPPIVDDPRWFGRIAAANSLSDVYAMGGTPMTAMNIVGWPRELDVEILGEVLAGGLDKMKEAGATLLGGHSVMDAEIKYGLSVTGMVHPERFWKNTGARPGDVLLLTKPLGMGPVSTAIKREKADVEMTQRAMEQMAALNKVAADTLRDFSVHAATDVTGFGLVGHSLEMTEGSGLALDLLAVDLPVLDGALQLVRSGVTSGGCSRGKDHYGARITIGSDVDAALADLVFDAETSGGLLVALPERQAAAAVERLRDAGAPSNAIIGTFGPARAGEPALSLR